MKKTILLIALAVVSFSSKAQMLGSLDSTFGSKGAVIIDQSGNNSPDIISGSTKGANGDIYFCGFYADTGNNIQVTHVLPDGLPDPGFGNQGTVRIDITGGLNEYPHDIVRLSDGSLLVAGYFEGSPDPQVDVFVLKLNANGTRNSNFGSNGVVKYELGGEDLVRRIAVRPDGKIVVAGEIYAAADEDFFVLLLNPDGTKVTSFGNQGVFFVDFNDDGDYLSSLAVDAGNSIYLGGRSLGISNVSMSIAKVTPQGALDNNFANAGKLTYLGNGQNTYLQTLRVDAQGRLVGVGYVGNSPNSQADALLFRMNSDGVFDTTLDGDGQKIFWVMEGNPGIDRLHSVEMQADGKIVTCGIFTEGASVKSMFYLRLESNATLDSGFGSMNGYYILRNTAFFDASLTNVHIISADRIMFVGRTFKTSYDALVIAVNATGRKHVGFEFELYDLNVYPNPARNYVQVEGLEEEVALSLYSMQGHLVRTWEKGTTLLDFNGTLTPGVYILRGQGSRGLYRTKLLIH